MVPLVPVWGGRFLAAPRPEEMSVVHLGVSWPWLLVDEWCCVSWSRNDGDNVFLNRCVLAIRAGEEWRGWIIRETETSSISALGSHRGAIPECSEETQEKTCRSIYPLSPKGHLSYGACFVLTFCPCCWEFCAPQRVSNSVHKELNLLRWLVTCESFYPFANKAAQLDLQCHWRLPARL